MSSSRRCEDQGSEGRWESQDPVEGNLVHESMLLAIVPYTSVPLGMAQLLKLVSWTDCGRLWKVSRHWKILMCQWSKRNWKTNTQWSQGNSGSTHSSCNLGSEHACAFFAMCVITTHSASRCSSALNYCMQWTVLTLLYMQRFLLLQKHSGLNTENNNFKTFLLPHIVKFWMFRNCYSNCWLEFYFKKVIVIK